VQSITTEMMKVAKVRLEPKTSGVTNSAFYSNRVMRRACSH